MNDIQQLIDRYLADPTMNPRQAPADFERLSRAVHRDDAPEEWLLIRDMIDALTESEEEYDLIMAARRGAVPAAEKAPSVSMNQDKRVRLVLPFFLRLAAAGILLFAVIGATLRYVYDGEKQIAEVEMACHHAASDTAISLAEAPASAAEPSSSVPEGESSAPSAATEKLTSKAAPTSDEVHHTETPRSVSSLSSVSKEQEQSCIADTPPSAYDVPERRIYSCNLLDQIPEE